MDENKTYSAEDLLRYAHGQMPTAERHALEKAALEDAFLAEALEGYVETIDDGQQTTYIPELNELRKIISNKASDKNEKEQAPVIHFFKNKFLRGAVAAVLIIGTAWWLYPISNKSKEITISTSNKQIAQVQPPVITNSTTIDTAPKREQRLVLADKTTVNIKPVPQQQVEAAPGIVKKGEMTDPIQVAPTMAPITKADSISASKDMALSENETVEKRSQIQSFETSKKEFAKNTTVAAGTPQKTNQALQNVTVASKKPSFIFKGRMMDANNNPLPFGSITVPRENFGTYTDEQGYFNFIYTDSILPVHVKSLGFEAQDFNMLAYKKENKIVLNEDKNLTYLRFAKQRKATDYKPTVIQVDSISSTIEPFIGWKNYDLYLANNNRISDLSSNNRTVLLSFEVGQDGDIKNITVDKSQGRDLDAEAIRLLKEGPKWKAKKRGEKGKVEMRF